MSNSTIVVGGAYAGHGPAFCRRFATKGHLPIASHTARAFDFRLMKESF